MYSKSQEQTLLCVTNRKLCAEDFLEHITKIAQEDVKGIILREKDLTEEEYYTLAKQVITICKKHNMLCILHNFTRTAEKLKHDAIHLPLPVLRTLCEEDRAAYKVLGASCHSIEDAKEAERLGCTYITAGHIFETDCKKGLKGRGLDFLGEVCESVSIPVYAIGGIDAQNFEEIKKIGAYGACIMSGLMKSENPGQYLAGFNLKRK